MLHGFNQNCNVSTNVSKTPKYQISLGMLVMSLPTEEFSSESLSSVLLILNQKEKW
jgi:hypothetical protein